MWSSQDDQERVVSPDVRVPGTPRLLYLLVSRLPSLRGGRGLFTLVLPGLLILLVKRLPPPGSRRR